MSPSIYTTFPMLLEQHATTSSLLQYFLLSVTLYILTSSLYSIFLSPLSTYPGPTVYALTKIPINFHHVSGNVLTRLKELHARYGPVVRVGPSELSYIGPAAWKDIYGFKTSTGGQMPKDPAFYELDPDPNGTNIDSDLSDESHGRQRKVFSHAFSDRALRAQENLIGAYVDKLIAKMSQKAYSAEKVDLVRMINFTTFDIMSDLAFGEPLDLLETNEYHAWVATIFDNLHAMAVMHAILQFPILKFLLNVLLPPSLKAQREKHVQFCKDKVDARLGKQTSRPDIWSLVIQAKENARLTQVEMYDNASLFMVAGTETTATLLSGLLYLLLTHDDKMKKLKAEVRALQNPELNLLHLPKLEYMHACIEEGLRIYPPVPGGLPRKTPKQGAIICGKFVPGNTTISIPHHTAYHASANFISPEIFAPERWLGAKEYESDRKGAFNPFSTGPRNCLGKNLAYHEMRLILAKLVWNFDFKLADEGQGNWLDQRVLLFWEKKPLVVSVKDIRK